MAAAVVVVGGGALLLVGAVVVVVVVAVVVNILFGPCMRFTGLIHEWVLDLTIVPQP